LRRSRRAGGIGDGDLSGERLMVFPPFRKLRRCRSRHRRPSRGNDERGIRMTSVWTKPFIIVPNVFGFAFVQRPPLMNRVHRIGGFRSIHCIEWFERFCGRNHATDDAYTLSPIAIAATGRSCPCPMGSSMFSSRDLRPVQPSVELIDAPWNRPCEKRTQVCRP